MQIAILGRQAGISIAELEALFGAEKITAVEDYAAIINSDQPLPQARLGGTMKSATIIKRLENMDLSEAFVHLQEFLPEHFMYLPKGKLQFGVSVYGFKAQRDWLLKRMLVLKKVIKKTGQSVRIIENKSETLESAQILYNKLTSKLGCELLLVAVGNDIIIAQTTAVQDIDDYAKRDFGRPMRDAFAGMLPPKLAQIMINLAVGEYGQFSDLSSQILDEDKIDPENSKNQDLRSKISILDPFCGTGVVLQEALLMGYSAYGTDLAERMVDYSTGNLQWLSSNFQLSASNFKIEQADATTYQWDTSKIQDLNSKIYIVCETYLGTPLSALLDRAKLNEIRHQVDSIAEGFLKNIAKQIPKGTRLTIALPAWHIGSNKFYHLPLLDQLSKLGYNRLEFVHATKSDLVYHRTDQIVARELTILEKN